MAFNKPFSSSSHAAPPEWKSKITTLNNEDVRVYEPTNTTTPVLITAPSLSVGDDPSVTVNKMKITADEILADNINAPITCQALLGSADTAVIASSDTNGYHTLPPSGEKIHDYFSSGNITELKTSDGIEAGKNLGVTSHLGRARISHGSYTSGGNTGSVVTFSHHDCSGSNYALIQTDYGMTQLNSETGQPIIFSNQGVEKMSIHSNGFVGINQPGPTVPLEVGGDIKSTGSITATGDITATGNFTTTGNLGIGTTNPLKKMHVNGDMLLMSPSQGTDAALFFGTPFTNSNSIKTAIIAEGQNDWSKSKLHFCVANAPFSNDPVNNASLSDARMTIQPNGNVGIGTTSPDYNLDVNGSFKAHTVETNRLYASAYNLSAISPDVWALAGDTTAYEGGGAITKSSAVSVKNLNGIPFWFFGDNDSDVTISNTITTGETWTIAIAITKKPESKGVIFAQLPTSETIHGGQNNHNIQWDGYFAGDEYYPPGGGWNTGGYISIPDESILIVRRNGTGANSLSVFLNGGRVYQAQYTETYSGHTPGKIRLGQFNRYSGYSGQTPLYMGIAAVAAWSSPVSDNNIRKFVNYQSLTTKA